MTHNIYITMQGDAWDSIAFRLWGDESLLMELVLANPEHMDTLIFPAGVTLIVPERPAKTPPLELPPWRT